MNNQSGGNKGIFLESDITPGKEDGVNLQTLQKVGDSMVVLAYNAQQEPVVYTGSGTKDWKEIKNNTVSQLASTIISEGAAPLFNINKGET